MATTAVALPLTEPPSATTFIFTKLSGRRSCSGKRSHVHRLAWLAGPWLCGSWLAHNGGVAFAGLPVTVHHDLLLCVVKPVGLQHLIQPFNRSGQLLAVSHVGAVVHAKVLEPVGVRCKQPPSDRLGDGSARCPRGTGQ